MPVFSWRPGICVRLIEFLAIRFKRDAAKNLRDRVSRRCTDERAHRFEFYTFAAWFTRVFERFPTCFARGLSTDRGLRMDYRWADSIRLQTGFSRLRSLWG